METQIERTSSGLRNALFDEIDKLRSGKSNIARAKAMAQLAHAILKSVAMEIEAQKYVAELGSEALEQKLGNLKLGYVKPEQVESF